VNTPSLIPFLIPSKRLPEEARILLRRPIAMALDIVI
jgi:hypothetical protein